MHLSPDEVIYWQYGFFKLNSTIVTTWGIMLAMVIGAIIMARNLTTGVDISRWQAALEIIIGLICAQMADIGLRPPGKHLGFIGTLFLFITAANLCIILPGYAPPTGSLSTTAALAICVFVAVPVFGISERGFLDYLKSYLEPTFIMLPFHLLGDVTRTLALAVRLFGNMMSGAMILAILLSVAPLFFPILTQALGLITGLVQAYIFTILAMVYIAAATRPPDTDGTI